MAQEPDRDWLTVSEVAHILGVSTETVRRRIARFELPASRARDARRVAWRIDKAVFEQQMAAETELATVRQRLASAGVVTGYDTDDFVKQVEDRHGPTTAEKVRFKIAGDELIERLQAEMASDPDVQIRLRELDDAERIEAKAQELARRVREAEAVRARALEILGEEEDES